MIQLQDQSLSFELRAAAADKILNLHARVWPVMLTLICLIGLHSFRVFHRFVGPLYRFQRAFGRVRDGDLSQRVRLRDKDYLHDEEKTLNEMIDRIAEKIDTASRAGSDALGSLDELKRAVGAAEGLNPIWEELFASHRRNLETFLETVRYFRLSREEKGAAERAEAKE
jgi:methyl-accepting chemotaxis protein